ncbi:MAG: hybrid sensor histidine kinase/response regulator, partial [Myxococcales bacterium]|nr:hybrid sensor histidine kinase/response regulator [Myxococcales bacterium]
PEAVDLAAIVERASATARGNLEAQSIRFTVEGTDQQLVVDGREESLQMMVLQLILYAAHECEGAADQPEIALRLYRDAERHVVAVAASGRSGQQTGARLYDNITRGARQATVGLELAKQTAIMHQGRLEIGISDLGGVLVKVSLPPVSDIVGHPAAPSPGARVEEMVADAFDAAPDDMSLDLDFGLEEPPPPPFPAQGGRSSPPHAERAAHRSAPPRTRGSAPPRTEPMTRSVPSRPPMSLDLELELPGGEPITEPALEEPGFGDLFFGDDEPLVDPAAPHHGHPPVDLGPAPNAPPLVLWIDHEVEAARILGGTLDGREVVVVGSAAEGREAMALLDRLPEVVFCAVALPDGSGPELHAEAPADLASRFVFIVGGLVGGDLAAYVQRSGCRTLIKPLTPDEVGGMLAEAAAVPEPTPSEPYADDSSFALSLANAEFGDLGIDDLDKDW